MTHSDRSNRLTADDRKTIHAAIASRVAGMDANARRSPEISSLAATGFHAIGCHYWDMRYCEVDEIRAMARDLVNQAGVKADHPTLGNGCHTQADLDRAAIAATREATDTRGLYEYAASLDYVPRFILASLLAGAERLEGIARKCETFASVRAAS